MDDWKVYVPLVTRPVSLEISEAVSSSPDGVQLQPKVRAFGNIGFLQSDC